jgi:hypothetical protein
VVETNEAQIIVAIRADGFLHENMDCGCNFVWRKGWSRHLLHLLDHCNGLHFHCRKGHGSSHTHSKSPTKIASVVTFLEVSYTMCVAVRSWVLLRFCPQEPYRISS